MRVLFVDDNEMNRSAGSALLRILVDDFRVAGSAEEAIELTKTFLPDVIMMDIAMPDVDGLEATREILKLDLARRPCILGVSGFVGPERKQAASDAGMVRFIEKPYTLNELRTVLGACQDDLENSV